MMILWISTLYLISGQIFSYDHLYKDNRELNPQDSGVYRFGVGTERHKDVELTVQTDSCCGRIEKMNANLGGTATFTCNYPDELKTSSKYLDNFNNQTIIEEIIYTEKDSQMEQEDRYSIFDDRRSKVFSVNISGVREDDGGVYLCGVGRKDKSVGYYSYFKEIHLRVTGSSLIISVCVCGALLLIGGAALIIYKLRNHMRQGQACCSDVVVYSGGSVILFPNLPWDVNHTRYVCKVEESGCTNIMKDQTNSKVVNAGRFKMNSNVDGNFTMRIRELNPQDSAVYRFGVGNQTHKDVELTVQTDSCCGRIEKMNAYLGETATFTCNYPDELKTNSKYLDFTLNLNNQSTVKDIITTRKDSQMEQKDRYSIFDDRRSKVFSVKISGVREDDGGVYLCGVWKKDKSVGYYSYFKEIQLQVTVMFVLLECESTEDSVSFSQCEVFLFWSAGPACCSDVVVYSGGSVTVLPDLPWDVNHTRYVCKVEHTGCTNIMKDQTKRNVVNAGRFKMYSNVHDKFVLLIRELNPQDSAVYRFGVGNQTHKDVELTVQTDSCCGRIEKMKAYLGETATFTCTYPDEFKTNSKYLTNLNNQNIKTIIKTEKDSQIEQVDRYSIFDDRRSKVFSVNISGVREDDGGVYLCGVWKKDQSVSYYPYFKEIQLQVTGSSLIISVCVCGALLLIGGAALIIYKLRNHMRQDSVVISQRTAKQNTDDDDDVYENIQHGNQYNLNMGPIHNRPDANPNRSDLVHEDFDSNTNQSDSEYQKIVVDPNQSDPEYEKIVFPVVFEHEEIKYTKDALTSCTDTSEIDIHFTQQLPKHPKPTYTTVSSTKFQGVQVTEDLSWRDNTASLARKAHQCLYFLHMLRRAKASTPITCTFYRGAIESILTSCITVWYKACTASCSRALQHIVTYPAPTLPIKPSAWQETLPTRYTASSTCCRQGGDCGVSGIGPAAEGQLHISTNISSFPSNVILNPRSNCIQVTLHIVPGITRINLPSVPQVLLRPNCGFWCSIATALGVSPSASPACGSDVVGYSEGSVILFPGLQWGLNHTRYVCKVEQSGCINLIKDQTNRNEVNPGRFIMYSNADGNFTMLIRELNPQDSAMYRFGVGTESYKDVELTVQTDSCCGIIEKINAYLGETATFTCNYPDEFKTNYKYVINLNNQTTVKEIIHTGKDSQVEQKDRYSIFDDRRSKVFSVNISGVREDDGGVYLCGVWKKDKSVGYYPYFKEIQLQVTGFSVIISVCVCGALLLIGGAALIIYKLRNHMKQDQRAVRVSRNTSTAVILNMGATQGRVLSPILFILLTHDCTPSHSSNLFMKFVDDTTMETDYRSESLGLEANRFQTRRRPCSITDSNLSTGRRELSLIMFVLLECECTEDSVSFSQCEVFLFWSTGPACCSDVVGYSGGSVLMFSDLQWDVNHFRYVCKVEQSGCIFIIKDEMNSKVVNAGRFKMYANSDNEFLLLIRELNPQDSAVYRFGVGTESHKDVELTVHTDSCCGRIEKMNAYLGETVTFTCNYPDEFKTNNKHLLSLNDQTTFNDIIYTKKDSQIEQEDRYSIFDDRRSKVFSVKISGVREDDGGVYLCGVWKYQSVGYYSYFKKIQVQVTGSSLIISVCVCGALLLIGGAALIIYKLRNHMRQGSLRLSSSDRRAATTGVSSLLLHLSIFLHQLFRQSVME
ncbi:hypothetical protein NFI96_013852 [Prochilodus magdalenae]|nr:hypothetical protein NFI96_013852 [Prochilodus magdalenae]